jgi:DNA polymerase-3 subunit gamma/tau
MSLLRMVTIRRAFRNEPVAVAADTPPPAEKKSLDQVVADSLPLSESSPAPAPAPAPIPAEVAPAEPVVVPTVSPAFADADINNLLAAVEEEVTSPVLADDLPPLDADLLVTAMESFREEGDAVLCTFLEQALPEMKGEDGFVLRFGSSRAIACVREDSSLITYLREYFQRPRLTMELVYDKSLKPARPEARKRLTPKDKFLMMREKNPALDELRRRFDLRPEE